MTREMNKLYVVLFGVINKIFLLVLYICVVIFMIVVVLLVLGGLKMMNGDCECGVIVFVIASFCFSFKCRFNIFRFDLLVVFMLRLLLNFGSKNDLYDEDFREFLIVLCMSFIVVCDILNDTLVLILLMYVFVKLGWNRYTMCLVFMNLIFF